MKKDIGLILQGGGAKGAYQVGSLIAISEIIKDYSQDKNPFKFISGVSVGSVNAAYLATVDYSFNESMLELGEKWLSLKNDDVYMLGKYGIISSFSNFFAQQNSLFDLYPLKSFLDREIEFDKISKNKILNIHVYSYDEGDNVVFCNQLENINSDHILASSSVPYIFNDIMINGKLYGDGGLSLRKPSNLLINMGCTRILGMSLDIDTEEKTKATAILKSIFPDSISDDFNEIKLKNKLVNRFSPFNKIKKIETLLIKPEIKDYKISQNSINSLSMSLRVATKIFGINPEESSSILNYIIFDREYADYLMRIGYSETIKKEKEILNFFGIKLFK